MRRQRRDPISGHAQATAFGSAEAHIQSVRRASDCNYLISAAGPVSAVGSVQEAGQTQRLDSLLFYFGTQIRICVSVDTPCPYSLGQQQTRSRVRE
jgi:hypothetical protein